MPDLTWINFDGLPKKTKILPLWEITREALKLGYGINKIDKNTGMVRFCGEKASINIYTTTFTVTTELIHPKQGKTQLHRRNLSSEEIVEILRNPRVHTGKGYHKKTK